MTKTGWQSGFESVLSKRATMHNWTPVQELLDPDANREAIAIVRSFESQLYFGPLDVCEEQLSAN